MRPRCPEHRCPLVFDERFVEWVPDGLGGVGVERRYVTERWVCPEDGCREIEEKVA